jgi:PKD repeat protein
MTANGTYKVCMKVSDTCNKCDTTICKSVTVDCACSAKAYITIDSVTSSGIVYLHSTSSGAAGFFWDFGDSSYSTSSSPAKHAYKASGSYQICLTVYDANKTCSTTYCVTIKVNKTRSNASVTNNGIVIPMNVYPNPATNNFTITTIGAASYQVFNLEGKLITSGSMNTSATVSADGWMNGVYIVRLTSTDGTGNQRIVIQK